jgi:(1->4)-alpha-D-glucan 1-alpha-D-glucosylmutase
LQLRREHPSAFGREGSYSPLSVAGDAADRVIAFARGGVVSAIVPVRVAGGFPDAAIVTLPDGEWRNVLTGDSHAGAVAFGALRGSGPLAVLMRG